MSDETPSIFERIQDIAFVLLLDLNRPIGVPLDFSYHGFQP